MTNNFKGGFKVKDKQKIVVVDTSVLMENLSELEVLVGNHQVAVPYTVLEELDNHKDNYRDNVRSYKGRNAIRFINRNFEKLMFLECDDTILKNDNKIIDVAIKHNALILTNDMCMKVKSRASKLSVLELGTAKINDNYQGYEEVYANIEDCKERLSDIYGNRCNNAFD